MKTTPRPTAPASFQRIILWTALWLAWAGEVVAGVMKRFRAGRALEARVADFMPFIANNVALILVVEALVRHGQNFRTCRRLQSFKEITRALIGGEVRRMLRGRNLAEWIAALVHVLRNRAAIVARIVRRLARGLMKAQPAQPVANREPALPFGALVIARADTS
jgi:hypothetical protein